MITEDLLSLKNEFTRIKNMGYVESTRNGPTGIGKTFEDLIGKEEDRECLPDYKGIEIKTKLSYTKAFINLFNYSPKGKTTCEIKRLVTKYGYYGQRLNTILRTTMPTLVRNRYLFKLVIDYQNKRIYLEIYNKYLDFLEKEAYWTFQDIENKLYTKLQYLALVKAFIKRSKKVNYYKYYSISFFKLKTFNDFLKLIEDGTIAIFIRISTFENQIKDYGTSFSIKEENLYKLFDKINI